MATGKDKNKRRVSYQEAVRETSGGDGDIPGDGPDPAATSAAPTDDRGALRQSRMAKRNSLRRNRTLNRFSSIAGGVGTALFGLDAVMSLMGGDKPDRMPELPYAPYPEEDPEMAEVERLEKMVSMAQASQHGQPSQIVMDPNLASVIQDNHQRLAQLSVRVPKSLAQIYAERGLVP